MSQSPLLFNSQFTPPRIGSHSILREQLLVRLSEARNSRLFLVTGGAGFGKTTLVAQWRQSLIQGGATVAWLSLSTDEGQLEPFCTNLVGALQQAGMALEGTLVPGEIVSDDALKPFLSLLVNSVARVKSDLYLIIDDFQHATDPRIDRLIQGLIERAPQNLHIVLASRTVPMLLLGRWRAMGEFCEIDGEELLFSFREAFAYLRSHLDQGIEVDVARALHDKTDGWPIGLQLLAIALKANPRRKLSAAALQPTRQALGAYLAEDVLADLPPPLLDFLQKISMLRRFNSTVAAHITGVDDAQALIQAIEARNLFLQPVDGPGDLQWFRLHPMFSEFLAEQLLASGYDIRSLHLRATRWFEEAGLVAEAARHALLTEDVDYLIGLLERIRPPLKSISHLSEFMCWLDRVPLETLAQHPELFLIGIWSSVLTLRTDKAEQWIAVWQQAGVVPDRRMELAVLKAAIANQRDDVGQCLQLLEPLAEQPLDSPFLAQVFASLYIGCLGTVGRHHDARRYFNSPQARGLRGNTHEMALIAVNSMAHVALFEGNMLEAVRIGSDLLAEAETVHGRRSVSACNCAALMATAFYELDRIDDAREALSNRLDILHIAVPELMINAVLCFARLQYLQESSRSALEFLRQREQHFRRLGSDRGVANMLAEQVRMVLADGDWRHGESLQMVLDDLQKQHLEPCPRSVEIKVLATLSLARVALSRRQPEMALRVLVELDALVSEYQRGVWRVRLDLLRCLALDQLGRDIEAGEALWHAVLSGYRLGLLRTFFDEGKVLSRLLHGLECPDNPDLDAYLDQLKQSPGPAPVDSEIDARIDGKGELTLLTDFDGGLSLTKRELEILVLLEQSMSNKRIALTLSLSLQTVKWNLRNIFGKLGVSNRYDAIVIARKRIKRA
ncbi:LuxR C-terminal-related transcriptional regulator [Pseudomonas sp. LS44]|uniref:LuxR C-terminal-related transcriptional regulator n=1 Tax=Pseudomonas sp. LS44 TaxID=1357074 RepID=UPI00215ADA5B|nr:LuxR C-terminal-related transcriptional regulator [Pseudomonas sp. LS44]UVE16115.1 LuxR C-terminal-related transcriptional regulator [Pseudomonas sp. LS44]